MNHLISKTKQEIEDHIFLRVELLARKTLLKMLTIVDKYDKRFAKYELLKLSNQRMDYIELLIIDIYMEEFYSKNVIDEYLADNKNIPSGSDYGYGRYFESFIISVASELFDTKTKDIKNADAVLTVEGKKIILEVKCSKTDTKKQVEGYRFALKTPLFLTVNGHKNSINFNHLTIGRIARNIFNETIKESKSA